MDCAALVERLDEVETHWGATAVLLGIWREQLPSTPVRKVGDDRWSERAALIRAVVDWFSRPVRESGDLTKADRERIAGWVTSSKLGIDAVEAVAWGLDRAAAPTFATAWRDELCANGDTRHVLGEGDMYPVPEAEWNWPEGLSPTSRPWSLTPPADDELPHVRVHHQGDYKIVADFGMAKDLEVIGAPRPRARSARHRCGRADRGAAGAEHESVDRRGRGALTGQRRRPASRRRRQLPRGGGRRRPQRVDWTRARRPAADVPSEGRPVSDEFGIDGPWKEGIAVGPEPEITIYHADRFRFASSPAKTSSTTTSCMRSAVWRRTCSAWRPCRRRPSRSRAARGSRC